MRYTYYTQCRFITGASPAEAAAAFNAAMMELADCKPTFERQGQDFYIFYQVEESAPETRLEECELEAGRVARCVECASCVRELNRFGQPKGNCKRATCGRTGERITIGHRACEAFYEEEVKK